MSWQANAASQMQYNPKTLSLAAVSHHTLLATVGCVQCCHAHPGCPACCPGYLSPPLLPPSGGSHPTDVRMTTRFKEEDLTEGLTGAIHETGEGLPAHAHTPSAPTSSHSVSRDPEAVWPAGDRASTDCQGCLALQTVAVRS